MKLKSLITGLFAAYAITVPMAATAYTDEQTVHPTGVELLSCYKGGDSCETEMYYKLAGMYHGVFAALNLRLDNDLCIPMNYGEFSDRVANDFANKPEVILGMPAQYVMVLAVQTYATSCEVLEEVKAYKELESSGQ